MVSTKRKETPGPQPEAPRFENGRALLIAGLREHYTSQTMRNIPELWQRFAPHIGRVAGQVGRVTYGVCFNAPSPAGVDYLTGVEVSSFAGLPEVFSHASIPALRYAVFPHREHVSKLRQTLDAVDQWLPVSGLQIPAVAGTPSFFERYGERFDPRTGMGDMEVWVPIKP